MAMGTRLPSTVLLPDSWHEPLEIHDQMTALCMAIVEKDCASHLDASWDRPGLYVLLDTPNLAHRFRCLCWQGGVRRAVPAEYPRTGQSLGPRVADPQGYRYRLVLGPGRLAGRGPERTPQRLSAGNPVEHPEAGR